jgi:hypothetical protein
VRGTLSPSTPCLRDLSLKNLFSRALEARILFWDAVRLIGRYYTLTILRRMTEKGLLLCEEGEDGIRTYSTELSQDAVTLRETEHFLDRVFGGSISMMLSAMTAGKRLTGDEIDALYEVLRQAEEQEQQED